MSQKGWRAVRAMPRPAYPNYAIAAVSLWAELAVIASSRH